MQRPGPKVTRSGSLGFAANRRAALGTPQRADALARAKPCRPQARQRVFELAMRRVPAFFRHESARAGDGRGTHISVHAGMGSPAKKGGYPAHASGAASKFREGDLP